MIELEYFVVCRSIATAIDSDELSLCNVLEDIFPQCFPDYIEQIMAVSCWRFTEDDLGVDYQAILKIILPGESEGVDFSMNFARGTSRFRAIQKIKSIPLDGAGNLVFKAYLNSKKEATHYVVVHPAQNTSDEDHEDVSSE